ncbi:hypothetical protein BV25DRAFT_1914619 [Artomyces pyxidatus]|nr:hypothetical protein BV25DRAFT_1914619 [Artomyces pyxidatus]
MNLEGVCVSLDMFSSKVEFFSALIDIMRTLKSLHQVGIVHGDISASNLALRDSPASYTHRKVATNSRIRSRTASGTTTPGTTTPAPPVGGAPSAPPVGGVPSASPAGGAPAAGEGDAREHRRGVILDFEHARRLQDQDYVISAFDRTAEVAFMPIEQMETPFVPAKPKKYQHDIESLLLVTMGTFCVFDGPGHPKDPYTTIINEWCSPDLPVSTLRGNKLQHLTGGAKPVFEHFTPYFYDTIPFVREFYDAVYPPRSPARESIYSSLTEINHDVIINIFKRAILHLQQSAMDKALDWIADEACPVKGTGKRNKKRRATCVDLDSPIFSFPTLTEYIMHCAETDEAEELAVLFGEDIKRHLLYTCRIPVPSGDAKRLRKYSFQRPDAAGPVTVPRF